MDVLKSAINVLKAGWGVLTSEISFVKYLYTYGKNFYGMYKSLSEN